MAISTKKYQKRKNAVIFLRQIVDFFFDMVYTV